MRRRFLPLPAGERSDCIVRCNPGEGLPRVLSALLPLTRMSSSMTSDLSPAGRGEEGEPRQPELIPLQVPGRLLKQSVR